MTSTEVALATQPDDHPRPRLFVRLRLLGVVRPRHGRRRVWDRLAMLEHDLERTRQLNREQGLMIEQLTVELQAATTAAWNASDRANEMERQLDLALEAHEANTHTTSFTFPERPGEPMEEVTHPVPVLEMRLDLADEDEEPENPVTSTIPIKVIAHTPSWAVTTEMPALRALVATQSATGTYRVANSPFATHDPAGFPGHR